MILIDPVVAAGLFTIFAGAMFIIGVFLMIVMVAIYFADRKADEEAV